MKQNPKILIIQTAYLGDVILTLPVVQNIKKLIPEAEIDFLCIPQTEEVLRNNPYLKNLVVYDKRGKNKISKLRGIISQVRKTRYDVVLSPHRSFRSALITHLSGAEIRIGFNKNSTSALLTRRVPYIKNVHEILRNLELVKAIPGITFTAENQILKPELFPSQQDAEFVENYFNNTQSTDLKNLTNLLTLAPCSKWYTKQLTKNKSVEIINCLTESGYNVILIGGSDDTAYCNEIEMAVSGPNLFNLCGRLTPLQSKVVMEKSICLISVDSAAAHIGASAGTPIMQIYGSTVPGFGFYPLTSKNIVIENNSLTCRPCTSHGRNSCPLKHFKCVEELDVNKIKDAVGNLVKNK